jgi:cytochrome c
VLKIGEREYFTKCFSCHSLEQGGGHKVGPNLWGIFGAKAGGNADFAYSAALKKSGVTWSSKTLDKWLASPAAFMPGNLMAFAGLPNERDRKSLIVYLQRNTGAK